MPSSANHGLIQWRDEFSLGVPWVDDEHRALIDLINQLYAALMQQGPGDAAGEFLGELYAQVGAHFALEEKLMREAAYPEYAAHKDDHEKLLDEIRDLMDEFDDGDAVDLEQFATALEAWFSVHFQTFDARLHDALG